MGRRLSKEEKIERAKIKYLIKKIRRTGKYMAWKCRVLRRDVKSYPRIPKGVQVHHKIEISKLVYQYEIKCVKDAIKCKALWEVDLGITLKRGEHFIFTKLGRYKYLTQGFRKLLEQWLATTKCDRLDADKKRNKYG